MGLKSKQENCWMPLIKSAAMLPHQDNEHRLLPKTILATGLFGCPQDLSLHFDFWWIRMLTRKGLPFGPLTVLEILRAAVPTPLLF
jgi:hypothetical protein